MRTNAEAIKQIMEADAFGHDTIAVVVDHKHWQMQMHLDTYFNIIDRDLCTMVASRLNAKPDNPNMSPLTSTQGSPHQEIPSREA